MVANSTDENQAGDSNLDRKSEIQAFDESKTGVKGFLDSGVTQIPRIFHCAQLSPDERSGSDYQFSISVIDLEGIHNNSILRTEVIDKVVNHGIPVNVLVEMINGIQRFHEQDTEEKKEFYSRDYGKKVLYLSNYDLYQSAAANWRDTFICFAAPNPPELEELPAVCRHIVDEYSKRAINLGLSLFELLSEALGLNPSHLKDMDCAEGLLRLGNYYPKCPEPELTLGTSVHTDGSFITILLQDHVGGLQVLHENQRVNVPPVHGALVVNVGDLLQTICICKLQWILEIIDCSMFLLITNDKFISVNHRVLAKHVGPRISVATFFRPNVQASSRVYGPIKELLSEENLPLYRETDAKEYLARYFSKGVDGISPLQQIRL
ncbi:hypothetical protein ACJW30_02G079900 [Castanea mollissima]